MSEQQYDWSAILEAAGITPTSNPTSLRQAIAAIAAHGGTTGQGAPVVRAFQFAYNTPSILTGAPLYTPTPGDILLNAWMEIDTAWNGTTPIGDFGQFLAGETEGLLNFISFVSANVDMSAADSAIQTTGSSIYGSTNGAGSSVDLVADSLTNSAGSSGATVNRYVPGVFRGADPIKVVVSQDGTVGGANPGSTQGAGVLYLVTATPL